MSKIKTLILENFKFFYGENKFDFDNKNILLYGENGSGKSSIYWSLYTLLQSSNKPTLKIQNYFNPRKRNINLLNKFIDPTDVGKISIKLTDNTTFVISNDASEINTGSNVVREANIASDFINYKLLSKLYDFKHSDTIDLFDLFYSDIFDYMMFDDTRTYSKVWEQLKEYEDNPPKIGTWRYTWLQQLISRFNEKLNSFLQSILSDINQILQNNFYKNLIVEYLYIPLEYDDSHYYRKYRKLKAPMIKITLKYDHHAISTLHTKNIAKPHTFLNEAKLTAIALSIRLSILRTRIVRDGVLKILVLDDLLISLDMNNRDIVLKMLLEDEYLKDYQIIILTHNKSFFEKAKQIFDYRAKNKWNYFEMYVDKKYIAPKFSFSINSMNNLHFQTDVTSQKNYIEVPYIKKLPHVYGNIEKAKEHFKNKDYPSCANYLRKEVEKLFDKFLQIDNLDEKIKLAKLKENEYLITEVGKNLDKLVKLLENFNQCQHMPANIQITKCNEFAQKLIEVLSETKNYIGNDFHFEEFEDVKLVLKSILHPQSHNDITKPLYKRELEEAIELLSSFNQIVNNTP